MRDIIHRGVSVEHVRENANGTVAVEILIENGFSRDQGIVGRRQYATIRQIVRAGIGVPDHELIRTGIFQRDRIAADDLLGGHEMPGIKLPHRHRRAEEGQFRAGSHAVIEEVITANLGQGRRAVTFDKVRAKANRCVAIEILMETGFRRLQITNWSEPVFFSATS